MRLSLQPPHLMPSPPASFAPSAMIAGREMTRTSSFISSAFCCIISCLLFFSVANVFFLEFSVPGFTLPLKPNIFRFWLSRNSNGGLAGRERKLEIRTNQFPISEVRQDGVDYDVTGFRSWKPGRMSVVNLYVYDLPRKFTFGVIEEYLRARRLLDKPVSHDWELQYPGNQHSAEWWLFSDLLKPQSERIGSPIVRVMHPNRADLFYVPFFSSLSLVVNPLKPDAHLPTTNYSDEQMQEELVLWLEQQETWHRHGGRDHVVICQDPNALHKVIDKFRRSVLLLSDFGRLEPVQGSWVKDVVLPYSHRISTYTKEDATVARRTLLFFLGNRFRKDGGKVRDQLFQVLKDEDDIVIKHGTQSLEARRLAAKGMRTSKYCLHPAGDTPSACRLFDAIVNLCVPVIVSDEIELPFEDILDYTKFAIFIPSVKAVKPGFLASTLRQIGSEKLQWYQQNLRKVRDYFEYDQPNGTVYHIWHQVAAKVPLIKTAIHRERRMASVLQQPGHCDCICSNMTHSRL